MQSNIQIGRIWGIPIGLNNSWFLIFGLVTWSLAVGYLPESYPNLSPIATWIVAAITSLLFFASVLAHELGHAYFALRNDIGVERISLFIFGGVAQIEKQPQSARAEFVIAIAGPLVSLLLAGVFGAIWFLSRNMTIAAAPAFWLARINLILAVFNMIPGFPLDGGRVLRAIVWGITNNVVRANRWAVVSGQLVAFGFLAIGIFNVFNGNLFNGLWLAFIGWFLQNAATANASQSNMHEQLKNVRVEQAMVKEWPRIPSKLPLSKLVNEHIMRGGPRYYFVERDGYGFDEDDTRPYGMVSVTDVTRLNAESWPITPADQVMTPWDKLITTTPLTGLNEAMKLMDDAGVAQLPVVTDHQLVGVLSRQQILRYLRLKSELGIDALSQN